MTSRKRKNRFGSRCGVAGEGRVVGVPKFHSGGKCTMPLTGPPEAICGWSGPAVGDEGKSYACVLTYVPY